MRNKNAIVFCIIVVLFLLAALYLPYDKTNAVSADDYNKYIYSHGTTAYFNNKCAFWDGHGFVTMSDGTIHADYQILSNDSGIYGSDNCLYYIEDNGFPVIRRSFGEQSKIVRSLPFLAVDSVGYAVRMGNGIGAFEVQYPLQNGSASAIYVVDLENESSPEKLILGGPGNIETVFSGLEHRENWLFVQSYDRETGKRSLYGYDLEQNELSLLSDDWERNNVVAVRENMLFWYDPDHGFFSMDLKDRNTNVLKELTPGEYYGFAMCDSEYFYASNCIPAAYNTKFEIRIPRGIYIFDYKGVQKDFIPINEADLCPAYLIADNNYVYFADAAQNMRPRWSLKKDMIGKPESELVEME